MENFLCGSKTICTKKKMRKTNADDNLWLIGRNSTVSFKASNRGDIQPFIGCPLAISKLKSIIYVGDQPTLHKNGTES